MNSPIHSTYLPLFAIHRLRIRRDSRLVSLMVRLFCHTQGGGVLCAASGAVVLYRPS